MSLRGMFCYHVYFENILLTAKFLIRILFINKNINCGYLNLEYSSSCSTLNPTFLDRYCDDEAVNIVPVTCQISRNIKMSHLF